MAMRFASRTARSVRPGASRLCLRISAPTAISRSPIRPLGSRGYASQLPADASATDTSTADIPATSITAADGTAASTPTAVKPAPRPDWKQGVEAEDLTNGTSRYIVHFSERGIGIRTRHHKMRNHEQLKPSVPSVWLRDSCRCSKCVNQETMQRNFRIFDDLAVRPVSVKVEQGGIRVIWSHENHESFYEWAFIERNLLGSQEGRPRPLPDVSKRRFWGSEIAESPPTVNYEEVMDSTSEKGLAKMTDLIMQNGFVFVKGTPFDDAAHTKKLLERIGPIRETHYGGFYDFVPDMAKADTAYTNIALPAHTDTTYFTDPAGLQAFHMLSHTALPGAPEGSQPSGGESLLVDGFHAAEILYKEDPKACRVLATYTVPWHASGNQGVTITPDQMHPVFTCYRRDNLRDTTAPVWEADGHNILRIRWNNDDRGVVPVRKMANRKVTMVHWYRAAAKWDEIIKRKSSEFWFQLQPGTTLIFDNYRVMHGRSAFEGLRRICGAYINRDDFMSRWRNTNLSKAEVLAQVAGY